MNLAISQKSICAVVRFGRSGSNPRLGSGIPGLGFFYATNSHSGNQTSRTIYSSPSLTDKVIFPGSLPQWRPAPRKGTRLKVDTSNGRSSGLDLGEPGRFEADGNGEWDLDYESQATPARGNVIGDSTWMIQPDQSSGGPKFDRVHGPARPRSMSSGMQSRFCIQPHTAQAGGMVCLELTRAK